jgi:hypothetical protein
LYEEQPWHAWHLDGGVLILSELPASPSIDFQATFTLPQLPVQTSNIGHFSQSLATFRELRATMGNYHFFQFYISVIPHEFHKKNR